MRKAILKSKPGYSFAITYTEDLKPSVIIATRDTIYKEPKWLKDSD